ncbi:aspartate/glutamate racemase family protein [Psychromonas aquimarina]|uniref:aspartate/glutamate racemase family protein n=1 Tax=Psychromonas aquimarina TaxID=444919 RepID=UPI0003FD05D5|nr:aspartate/glutamate racemase family protein [Psychromonas aquimarina]
MKTIGLLGGMSWQSTVSYYQAINQGVNEQLGGLHSAKIILNSVDFAEIEKLQHAGLWNETADILSEAAKSLQHAGADFLMICTNTMHKVASEIDSCIDIPVLHIADATASKLVADNITKVGLLGTRFTMAQDFYKKRLTDNFAIDVVVPCESDQTIVHDIIYNELCNGHIIDSSRGQYVQIINKLFKQGAQAVILGCTEIALLVKEGDTTVPLYDTTAIHAHSAVQYALKG